MTSRQRSKLKHAARRLLRKDHKLIAEEEQDTAHAQKVSTSQPKEPTPRTERLIKTDERQTKQPNTKRRFWIDYEPTEKFNLLIAVGTTLYFGVTVLIYLTAKQELKVSQRAFVHAGDPFLVGDGGLPGVPSGKPAFLVIDLNNSGNTLARKTSINTNYCAIVQKFIPGNFGFPPTPGSQPTLGLAPKTSGQTSFPVPESVLADVEANKLTALRQNPTE